MAQPKAVSKKEAQEPDEFLDVSHRLWTWANENRAQAAGVVGAVLAAILLALLAKGLVERGREQRAAEVAAAVGRYLAGEDAGSAGELSALADRMGSSPGGVVARYFSAGALAAAGETDRAAEAFARAGREAGDSDLAPLARVAAGYLALDAGDEEEAAATFADLLEGEGSVVPRAMLRLELAAIRQRAGRIDEARALLEAVAGEDAEGPLAAKAKERLAALPAPGASS